jgi:hypothetical protein
MGPPVRLPSGARAIVPEVKIMEYLLAMTHLVGRSKTTLA